MMRSLIFLINGNSRLSCEQRKPTRRDKQRHATVCSSRVPEILYVLERHKISTAAHRYAACIVHWTRSRSRSKLSRRSIFSPADLPLASHLSAAASVGASASQRCPPDTRALVRGSLWYSKIQRNQQKPKASPCQGRCRV